MSKPKTIWWALPLSDTCNRSLADYLGEEAIQTGIATTIGKKDLYQLRSFDDVRKYASSGLKCDFFKQAGSDGEIVPWVPEPWMRKKIPYMVRKDT